LSENGLVKWVQKFDPYLPESLPSRDGLHPILLEESRTKTRFAKYALIAICVFLAWAMLAPLDDGVLVKGTVMVQGNRKAVQHQQGGVVEKILVKEGSVVRQGDTLVRVNPRGLEAELNAIDLDFINALVVESRLVTERGGAATIRWLPELVAYGAEPKVREAMASQERILFTRRQDLNTKINVLSQQAAGYEAQIRDLGDVIATKRDQLKLISEEVKNLKQLASEGFVPGAKATELERMRSELLGGISSTTSEISKARSALSEAKLKIGQEKSAFQKEVEAELSTIQKSRKEFKLNAESVRFNLSLADLKAPVDGVVVGIKVFTEGGVIKGGETIMEIVPQSDNLLVHAKVPPDLVDNVQVGLEADMRFTAFNRTTTPVIPGKVILVAADRQSKTVQDDEATPPEYYLAHVEASPEGRSLLGSNSVQVGMSVDIIVKTGERTFMSYLLKPVLDRFSTSFKEN
jgi:membrane fusion protein, protease secretion system